MDEYIFCAEFKFANLTEFKFANHSFEFTYKALWVIYVPKNSSLECYNCEPISYSYFINIWSIVIVRKAYCNSGS